MMLMDRQVDLKSRKWSVGVCTKKMAPTQLVQNLCVRILTGVDNSFAVLTAGAHDEWLRKCPVRAIFVALRRIVNFYRLLFTRMVDMVVIIVQ
jgi:hypothetical protein